MQETIQTACCASTEGRDGTLILQTFKPWGACSVLNFHSTAQDMIQMVKKLMTAMVTAVIKVIVHLMINSSPPMSISNLIIRHSHHSKRELVSVRATCPAGTETAAGLADQTMKIRVQGLMRRRPLIGVPTGCWMQRTQPLHSRAIIRLGWHLTHAFVACSFLPSRQQLANPAK